MGKEVKNSIDTVLPYISLQRLSKDYFGRHSSWLYHKLNEDVINGVRYQLNEEELRVLSAALKDIAAKISVTSNTIEQLYERRKRQRGRYYTLANPFELKAFRSWWESIDVAKNSVIEPFAGECHIPRMLCEAGYDIKWRCYDLHSYKHEDYKVSKRNTLQNFPQGYNVCITNPPYLRKAAASRLKLSFQATEYEDMYMLALERILCHCKYAAVIVPESFINSRLFVNRLECVVSLNWKMFGDTDFPVCLALFSPNPSKTDFYIGNQYIDTIQNLQQYKVSDTEDVCQWIFNAPHGNIGVKCIDGKDCADISFVRGETINPKEIKATSRSYTRISGLPSDVDTDAIIKQCNAILNEYREKTHDVFITSFKGLRKDGRYRRRLDFRTIRAILNQAYKIFTTDCK